MPSCYLSAGETLRKGQQLIALNEDYNLIHQYDGNVVLYGGAEKVWETGTSGSKSTDFKLQEDGNLVLSDGDTELWSSDTADSGGVILILQDNGDCGMWDANHVSVYKFGTGIPGSSLSFDHSKIPVTGVLPTNGSLRSTGVITNLGIDPVGVITLNFEGSDNVTWLEGGAYLVMQNDGNFVYYDDDSNIIWQSDTVGSGATTAMLLDNGKLVLVNDANTTEENAEDNTVAVVVDFKDL